MVISIIAVIFLISKSLFVNPNQDLISSEICINTINGDLSTFFYEGITGKDQIDKITKISISPIKYLIGIDSVNFQSRISLTAKGETGQVVNVF